MNNTIKSIRLWGAFWTFRLDNKSWLMLRFDIFPDWIYASGVSRWKHQHDVDWLTGALMDSAKQSAALIQEGLGQFASDRSFVFNKGTFVQPLGGGRS